MRSDVGKGSERSCRATSPALLQSLRSKLGDARAPNLNAASLHQRKQFNHASDALRTRRNVTNMGHLPSGIFLSTALPGPPLPFASDVLHLPTEGQPNVTVIFHFRMPSPHNSNHLVNSACL
jgi:hypothetical protein